MEVQRLMMTHLQFATLLMDTFEKLSTILELLLLQVLMKVSACQFAMRNLITLPENVGVLWAA